MKQMLIKSANNFIDRSSTIKRRCESMHFVACMCDDDMLILIAKKLVYNFFIAQVMHLNKLKFF